VLSINLVVKVNMPQISVITPVFNSVQFIELCILNVITQKCNDMEHIIVDGGSVDGTVDVIRDYAKKYSHIQWISEKDEGQSNAMNKGINMAKGEYISFLNSDDYYSDGVLNDVLDIISKKDAPAFIVGNCNVFDDKQQLIYVNEPKKVTPWHLLSGTYLPVNPSAYFYKKNIHDIVGMYNENNHYNMDIEFLIQVSLVIPISYLNKNWGNFRLLPHTKTGSDIEKNVLEKRKQELFSKYIDTVSLGIKMKIVSAKLYKKSNTYFYKIKKIIFLPFDMIYWKAIKIINTKKLN